MSKQIEAGKKATITGPFFKGQVVLIVGRYLAPGASSDEWVVERSNGRTMAIKARDLKAI